MAKKKLLGIEIGLCRMKMAVCSDGKLERMIIADVPDNLVRENEIISWEAMADFIRETVKKNGVSYKNVAVAIPEKQAYTQRITMPVMTEEQLKVNLPYEFKDYITTDKDKYFYDYAVLETHEDEAGNKTEMDLMAVAVLKETVNKYKTMFRRAGLRLVLIAPEFSAVRNIIKDYEEVNHITEPRDYAVFDIGQGEQAIYFFTHGEYDITHAMETACKDLDRKIADIMDVDEHIARIYKEQNKDDILNDAGCMEIYHDMAVEVMRVLNFYNFNHPDNTLDTLYCSGGGSLIEPLIDAVREGVDIRVAGISELFTDKYDDELMRKLVTGPKALGITWE